MHRLSGKKFKMKKFLLPLLAGAILAGCEKATISETRSTMHQADSLFRSANESFRTLDSISAAVNDSAKFNKVVGPQLEKTKREIERSIRENKVNLDSLDAVINIVKNTVEKSAVVIKTVDSANRQLQGDGSIFDKIGTITGTISKISKKATVQRDTLYTNPSSSSAPNQYPDDKQKIETTPLTKSATVEAEVDNVPNARNEIVDMLRDYRADIVSENHTENEGVQKQVIKVKVSLRNFDAVMENISAAFGNNISQNVAVEGIDFDPNRMGDIVITLRESGKGYGANVTSITEEKPDSFGSKSSDAFKKGASGFSDTLLALIPFWPVVVVGGLIWYLISRQKRKRREEEFQRQLALERERQHATTMRESIRTEPVTEQPTPQETTERKDDDYTRFMPKK